MSQFKRRPFQAHEQKFRDLAMKLHQVMVENHISYPENPEVEEQVNLMVQSKQSEKALAICDVEISKQPFSAEALCLKASVLMLQDQGEEEALQLVERALNFQPTDQEALIMAGKISRELDEIEEAGKYFERALVLHPKEPLVMLEHAKHIHRKGDLRQAKHFYQKALELDPSFKLAAVYLTGVMDELGELDKSIAYFEKFTDVDPFNDEAWTNLAAAHGRLRQIDQAIEATEYAMAIDDENPSTLTLMAQLLFMKKKYTDAFELLGRASGISGLGFDLICVKGLCLLQNKDYERAFLLFKKALELHPFFDWAWNAAGKCLYKMNKPLEAIHFLRQAIRHDDQVQDYWLDIALAEKMLGNDYAAEEAFRKGAELHAESPEIWLEWAFFMYESGDSDAAREIIEDGLSDFPDSAELLYMAGAYCYANKRTAEGLSYLQNAVLLDFDLHPIIFRYFKDHQQRMAFARLILSMKD